MDVKTSSQRKVRLNNFSIELEQINQFEVTKSRSAPRDSRKRGNAKVAHKRSAKQKYSCPTCKKVYVRKDFYLKHLQKHETDVNTVIQPSLNNEIQPSLNKEIQTSSSMEIQPSLNTEMQPSINTAIQPSLNMEMQPSLIMELPPSLIMEIQPCLNRNNQPSLDTDIQLILDMEMQPTVNTDIQSQETPNHRLVQVTEERSIKIKRVQIRQNDNRILNVCGICTKTFRKYSLYQMHVDGHLQAAKLQVPKNNEENNTIAQSFANIEASTVLVPDCPYCGKKFTKSINFHMHVRQHDGENASNICQYCGQKFIYLKSWHMHLIKHQELFNGNASEPIEIDSESEAETS